MHHGSLPALRGLVNTHARHEEVVTGHRKALGGGEEVGRQKVQKGLFKLGELPGQGMGHRMDRWYRGSDQSSPAGMGEMRRGLWERWLRMCFRTEKAIGPKDF